MKVVNRFSGNLTILLCLVSLTGCNAHCISLGNICTDDCDCCGEGSRCEKRNDERRCYEQPTFVGKSCTQNSECISQKCENNICVPNASGDPNRCLKSFFNSFQSLDAVVGQVSQETHLCPCTGLAPNEISLNINHAIDKSTNTDYINNYSNGSGFEVSTNLHAPIREIKVCTNQDCPECDPMSYKIEGKCDSDSTFTFIQDGNLDLSQDRQTCTNVRIVGRHEYNTYRITFPSVRGGFNLCSETLCDSTPASGHLGCQATQEFDYYPLQFQGHQYDPVSDKTSFAYIFGRKHDINEISHFILQWEGHCCFLYYELFRVETNFFNGPNYDLVKNATVELVTDVPDSDLCMNGIKLDSFDPDTGDHLMPGSHWHLFVLHLRGNVGVTEKDYGTFGGNLRDYDSVESPDCSQTSYPPPTCYNYPMKISEIDLLAKCNES